MLNKVILIIWTVAVIFRIATNSLEIPDMLKNITFAVFLTATGLYIFFFLGKPEKEE